jgi:hypothetical protein
MALQYYCVREIHTRRASQGLADYRTSDVTLILAVFLA